MSKTVDTAGTKPVSSLFKSVGGMQTYGTAKVVDGKYFNRLGLESSAAHPHISKDWQKQCVPFLALLEQVEAQAEGKEDVIIDQSELRFTDDLCLTNGSTFTNNGLKSVITKYTDVPTTMATYLSSPYSYSDLKSDDEFASHKAFLAYTLNNALERNNYQWATERTRKAARTFLLRLRNNPYDPELNKIVRMVGSDRYGVVDNIDVMNWVKDSLPKDDIGDVLVSHLYSDFDFMAGSFLVPDGMTYQDDSDWGVGFAFSNSEDGTHKLYFCPFLFKAVCSNGCVYGRADAYTALDKKHLGEMDKGSLADQICNLTMQGLTLGNMMLARMMDTKDITFPTEHASKVVAYLSKANQLTIAEGRRWFNGFLTEGGMTSKTTNANTIVNGLTRAAQEFEGQDRWNLETLAGNIMTPALDADKTAIAKSWGNILTRAKNDISDKMGAKYANVGAGSEEE